MPSIHSVLTGLAVFVAGLPLVAQAQSPNLAGGNYIGVELGTGKVDLSCPANVGCSRVDSSGIVRAGYRFDTSWAFEVTYSRIDADWGLWGANYSASFTGFGLGAAYTVPLSERIGALARLGAVSGDLKLQPAVGISGKNPGTLTTHSVKPYAGLAVSWQFARQWSTSLNADWTRVDLRETASSARQGVTVRMLGAGIVFNF